MGSIRTNAAAAMLGVSPNTLRSWERRFGFPEPRRTAGGHRQFDLSEIEALRAAFEETHNVSSAITVARERGTGPASPARLRSAFLRFDEHEADRIIEESLSVRSVERSIEEVILPTVETLSDEGDEAPEYGYAWRWASGWLAAQRRVAPPAFRDDTIVIFDASHPGDMDALHAQALELVLRRSGVRTLTLTVSLDASRLTRALHAVAPQAVILTGQRASLDTLSRLVYTARRVSGGDVAVLDYRGALPDTGATTVEHLGQTPLGARELVLAHLDPTSAAVRDSRRAAVLLEAAAG
jgi:DNA-binding transcriptional MerR regulator